MALITAIAPSLAGTTVTEGAAAASDTFPRNQGDNLLIVFNGGGSSINCTFTSYASPDPGESAQNLVVAVPAGARKIIGPFPQQFENPADGLVTVAFSATTSVTRYVLDQS